MLSNKLLQLKQDINEVNGVIEDLEPYQGYLDTKFQELKDKFDLLQEHMKDHIEDVENFIGNIN